MWSLSCNVVGLVVFGIVFVDASSKALILKLQEIDLISLRQRKIIIPLIQMNIVDRIIMVELFLLQIQITHKSQNQIFLKIMTAMPLRTTIGNFNRFRFCISTGCKIKSGATIRSELGVLGGLDLRIPNIPKFLV